MSRRYPQFHSGGQLKKAPGKECECCYEPATHFVRIEYSYMRGEDEFYDVCERHHSMARNKLDRFHVHMRTKGKSFNKPPAAPAQPTETVNEEAKNSAA